MGNLLSISFVVIFVFLIQLAIDKHLPMPRFEPLPLVSEATALPTEPQPLTAMPRNVVLHILAHSIFMISPQL